MKTILKITLLLLTCLVNAQDLKLETTALIWTGKAAFSNYELSGSLKTKSGVIGFKKDSIIKLSITIDMKTLDHENNDLKNHLKGKDFFEIKKYNEATFILTKPVIVAEGQCVLIGDMTIKGVTNQEKFPINIDVKNNEITISYNCIIDRTTYGVTFNSPTVFEKLKENAIEDKFKLKGQLKFR